jgi:hypothetical protein
MTEFEVAQLLNLSTVVLSGSAVIYLLQEEIKLVLCKAFGFKVVGVGFKKTHYTLTKSEALQWMGCYDEALLFKGKTLVGSKFRYFKAL